MKMKQVDLGARETFKYKTVDYLILQTKDILTCTALLALQGIGVRHKGQHLHRKLPKVKAHISLVLVQPIKTEAGAVPPWLPGVSILAPPVRACHTPPLIRESSKYTRGDRLGLGAQISSRL